MQQSQTSPQKNFRFNLIEENPSHQLPTDLLGLLGLDPRAHWGPGAYSKETSGLEYHKLVGEGDDISGVHCTCCHGPPVEACYGIVSVDCRVLLCTVSNPWKTFSEGDIPN